MMYNILYYTYTVPFMHENFDCRLLGMGNSKDLFGRQLVGGLCILDTMAAGTLWSTFT